MAILAQYSAPEGEGILCRKWDHALCAWGLHPTEWGEMKRLASRVELTRWLPHHAVVAEIGVERGDFTKLILEVASPRKLYLIDAWEYQDESVYPETVSPIRNSHEKQDENYRYVIRRFEPQIQRGQVVVNRGYSTDVLKEFRDNYFDWVYIDANHQYEFVKQDLELCRLKVRRGGFICGHDYIEGNNVTGVQYGVIQAVDWFCEKYGWKIICTADLFWEGGNYLSYVLAQKGMMGLLRRLSHFMS